jgi:hypothetical protein
MVELVAIPKDLFERMADAVFDLHRMFDEEEAEVEEGTRDEIRDPAAHERISALYDDIEESWPETTFSPNQLEKVPGRKWTRQKKLGGS